MTIRTRQYTVTFNRCFFLAGFDEELPAGAYRVETDEELLDTVSFQAWRRVWAVIHLHPDAAHPGRSRSLTIDPLELDAAVARDSLAREHAPERPNPVSGTHDA